MKINGMSFIIILSHVPSYPCIIYIVRTVLCFHAQIFYILQSREKRKKFEYINMYNDFDETNNQRTTTTGYTM